MTQQTETTMVTSAKETEDIIEATEALKRGERIIMHMPSGERVEMRPNAVALERITAEQERKQKLEEAKEEGRKEAAKAYTTLNRMQQPIIRKKSADGYSMGEFGKMVDRDEQTIRNWIKRKKLNRPQGQPLTYEIIDSKVLADQWVRIYKEFNKRALPRIKKRSKIDVEQIPDPNSDFRNNLK